MGAWNKTSKVTLSKALAGRGMSDADWNTFTKIIKHRKEAYATALVLGLANDRCFMGSPERLKEFFITRLEGIASPWARYENMEDLQRLFKAWKPFLKTYGLKNGKEFARIYTTGTWALIDMRAARCDGRLLRDFIVSAITIDYIVPKETSIKSPVCIRMEYANPNRIRMNKAMLTWIAKVIAKRLDRKHVVERIGHWVSSNPFTLRIDHGTFSLTTEKEE